MKLSIVIPVYNEQDTLKEILKKVEDVKLKDIQKEIILVDDYSTDNTKSILKKIKEDHIKIYYHEKNKGKGAAVKTGINKATGDTIIIQDADLEYDPQDYIILLDSYYKGNKIVYGSRFLNKSHREFKEHSSFLSSHYLGNKFLSLLTTLLYQKRVTDMETCYKLFKADIIQNLNLKEDRFGFEPEVTSKILKKHSIVEVPISFYPRGFDKGKKITWRDGVKALGYLIKYKFLD